MGERRIKEFVARYARYYRLGPHRPDPPQTRVKCATRVQVCREERLVAQAGARGAPAMTREAAARAHGAEAAELESRACRAA